MQFFLELRLFTYLVRKRIIWLATSTNKNLQPRTELGLRI